MLRLGHGAGHNGRQILCQQTCAQNNALTVKNLIENQWKANYPGWSLLRRGTDFEYIVWNLALENKTPKLSPVEFGVIFFSVSK